MELFTKLGDTLQFRELQLGRLLNMAFYPPLLIVCVALCPLEQ
jgi:ABC-type uncharacterized transport system involved in gliding motility auxiliary subunit